MARLASAGIYGGDFDRIEQGMTLPRLRMLEDEWKNRPPVHWIASWYFKLDKSGDKKPGGMKELAEYLGVEPGQGKSAVLK